MIRYDVAQAGRVRLTIYNALGQPIRQLVDAVQAVGRYTVQWDGRDDRGQAVASGIYLYRLEAGGFASMQRMVLVR
jgi:flagellar hook assembly protein FlgD